jgi:hypothetical protein
MFDEQTRDGEGEVKAQKKELYHSSGVSHTIMNIRS